jgi:hypothetical protein
MIHLLEFLTVVHGHTGTCAIITSRYLPYPSETLLGLNLAARPTTGSCDHVSPLGSWPSCNWLHKVGKDRSAIQFCSGHRAPRCLKPYEAIIPGRSSWKASRTAQPLLVGEYLSSTCFATISEIRTDPCSQLQFQFLSGTVRILFLIALTICAT